MGGWIRRKGESEYKREIVLREEAIASRGCWKVDSERRKYSLSSEARGRKEERKRKEDFFHCPVTNSLWATTKTSLNLSLLIHKVKPGPRWAVEDEKLYNFALDIFLRIPSPPLLSSNNQLPIIVIIAIVADIIYCMSQRSYPARMHSEKLHSGEII